MKSNDKWILESVGAVGVPPLWLNLSHMYIYNPSSLAVQLHLLRLYCPRVHLGWTQTAPLGAFMPTTMWLSWHFVCDWPPQPYSTAAIFSGLRLATKTLGRKKWDVKKENKQHDWWPSLILFSATPEWMIADYLWLSVQLWNNCSFCAYLTGDICFNCPFETNLQPPLSENQMFFFCLHKGRCNYFAMLA